MMTEPPVALELLPADSVKLPANKYVTCFAPHKNRIDSRTDEHVETNIIKGNANDGKNDFGKENASDNWQQT